MASWVAVAAALVLGSFPAASVKPLHSTDGVVMQVDARAGTVDVRAAEGALKLKLTRGTTIFLRGHVGRLEDLSKGLRVRAAYENDSTAEWIEVL